MSAECKFELSVTIKEICIVKGKICICRILTELFCTHFLRAEQTVQVDFSYQVQGSKSFERNPALLQSGNLKTVIMWLSDYVLLCTSETELRKISLRIPQRPSERCSHTFKQLTGDQFAWFCPLNLEYSVSSDLFGSCIGCSSLENVRLGWKRQNTRGNQHESATEISFLSNSRWSGVLHKRGRGGGDSNHHRRSVHLLHLSGTFHHQHFAWQESDEIFKARWKDLHRHSTRDILCQISPLGFAQLASQHQSGPECSCSI